MDKPDKLHAHVFVYGKVQGVNFRWSTQEQANLYNVTGWVRNLSDGRVEAVFEGYSDAVYNIISWCQIGPPTAWVSKLDIGFSPPVNNFTDFRITW